MQHGVVLGFLSNALLASILNESRSQASEGFHGPYGFSSFSSGPVLNALREPWHRLIQRAIHSYRQNGEQRVYLGAGQPVIVFPMFGEGPMSTSGLRHVLSEAGFAAHDWSLGVDSGPGEPGLKRMLRRLEEHVIETFEEERQPVTLLGWGLSGIYAREAAKRVSPLVRLADIREHRHRAGDASRAGRSSQSVGDRHAPTRAAGRRVAAVRALEGALLALFALGEDWPVRVASFSGQGEPLHATALGARALIAPGSWLATRPAPRTR